MYAARLLATRGFQDRESIPSGVPSPASMIALGSASEGTYSGKKGVGGS